MVILGISFTHDGTISVLRDGAHVFSLAEERLVRIKSYIGFPFAALRYIIDHGIVRPGEVECVAVAAARFNRKWARTFAIELTERKRYYDFQNEQEPADFFVDDDEWRAIRSDDDCRAYVARKLSGLLANVGIHAPIVFFDHHRCHAASAYFASGRNQALAITLDGEGDEVSGSVSLCRDGAIETLVELPVIASMGNFYSELTRFLGFKVSRHEGKITGLAAYGDPARGWARLRHEVGVRDGRIVFRRFHSWRKLYDRLRMNLGLIPRSNRWRLIIESIADLPREDMAAAVQHALEERVAEFVAHWVRRSGCGDIVAAGGVFANVKLNGRLAELPDVTSLFVYPDMGDGGNAIGAAWLAHRARQGAMPAGRIDSVYLGPEFDDDAIVTILGRTPALTVRRSDNAPHETARLIADGRIVGWFQGRMEYGPRALGNRSILAAPVDASINKWLNKRMRRTEFMPFAPSCLFEAADEVFEIGKAAMTFPAEFMTITFAMRKEWIAKAPAVAHVDGTARPHLVRAEINPRYHALLSEYRRLTGLPLVVNTSFNVHEEPIVCRPEEAVRSLIDGVIDVLVIGDYIVTAPASAAGSPA